MAYSGLFKPKHPEKYVGDANNIVYRSSWEVRVMRWLDENPNIITWASEELHISYKSPIDNRFHRYFPDFIVKKKSPEGKIDTIVVEIKPHAQTRPPVVINKPSKRYINEVMTWGVNEAKWRAAAVYCNDRGWKFDILTEKELGIKF